LASVVLSDALSWTDLLEKLIYWSIGCPGGWELQADPELRQMSPEAAAVAWLRRGMLAD